MIELSRGANSPLDAKTLDVAVTGAVPGAVDMMVFQLAENRKVRSDADFVFFNQPTSPEGAVRLTAGDQITIKLDHVPPAVHVLAVAVALSDVTAGTLADIEGLAVSAADLSAPALGLSTERAAVLIEVYRRGPQWKIRNVSAGWTAGLDALVREHGVVVDDPGQTNGHVVPQSSSGRVTPVAASARNPSGWVLPAASAAGPPIVPTLDLGKRTGKVSLAKGQRVSIESRRLSSPASRGRLLPTTTFTRWSDTTTARP